MRVSKWGNGLAIRLPKDIVEAIGLAAGDELRIVQAAAERSHLRRAVDANGPPAVRLRTPNPLSPAPRRWCRP